MEHLQHTSAVNKGGSHQFQGCHIPSQVVRQCLHHCQPFLPCISTCGHCTSHVSRFETHGHNWCAHLGRWAPSGTLGFNGMCLYGEMLPQQLSPCLSALPSLYFPFPLLMLSSGRAQAAAGRGHGNLQVLGTGGGFLCWLPVLRSPLPLA